jgi:hypothetical protein
MHDHEASMALDLDLGGISNEHGGNHLVTLPTPDPAQAEPPWPGTG